MGWSVDARKLTTRDTKAVSPPFELSLGGREATFKLMLVPVCTADKKGGSSFKKAQGMGKILMKCEADFDIPEDVANVRFRLAVGSGAKQHCRGPVDHNFSQNSLCGLPAAEEVWDFHTAVDEASMTFVACVEIVPCQKT